MLPGKSLTSNDILGILKRRRRLILVPFAIGLAVVPLVAGLVPRVYRSETLIMVIPQRVPENYVKSTVTETVEDRLPSISDQILSRSRLERVIEDYRLYESQRAKAPMEDIVRKMRTDVGPVSIKVGERSFRVGYTSEDPKTAQRVAARLASLFIEENSRDRESLAENTNVFLESQLEEAKQRLVQHEQKLTLFRQAHAGELPSQLESNLRSMQALQLQLQLVSETLNRARERRMFNERQIVDAQTLPIAMTAPPGTVIPDAQGIPSAAQQLEIAEARLQANKSKFTADHPEMKSLERLITKLKRDVADEAKRPPQAAVDRVQTPMEQARQKRIRDLQADTEVVDHQIDVGQAEEARLKSVLADYQRKIDAVPRRDSEYTELSRDYDVLKKSYDSLLTRREDSQLAANLERRQIGEQFRILDPASLPARPSNEITRLAFSFASAAIGLIIGLALTALLEFRDSSFASEDDVARVLTLPVLALVPVMISQREQHRTRTQRMLLDIGATTVLVVSAAVVVVWGLTQR